jgi:hypothetical protein
VPVGDIAALAQAIVVGLDSNASPPSEESWLRFEINKVVDQYLSILLDS